MRSKALLLALLFSSNAFAAPKSVAERLDEYLRARTSLSQFSGTVVVAQNGKILLEAAYGYANLEHRVPNTIDTRFEIASLTKAFTGAAVAKLQRDGKLQFGDSICRYVSDCPATWQLVTIDEVIHHTSGIPDYEEALDLGSDAYAARMILPHTGTTLIEEAKKNPLDFAPGSKFHYSNTGYLILGQVIERVSGISYEQYLRDSFFDPMGLKHTGHADATRVQSRTAYGYTHAAPLAASVGGFPLTERWLQPVQGARLDAPHADGGLLSTAGDLFRWAEELEGRGHVLAPEMRKELLRTTLNNYAFGWVDDKRLDREWIHHTGVLPGFLSSIDRYPESGTVIVLLSNLERTRVAVITRDLAAIVFGLPYDLPRSHHVGPLAATEAAAHLGNYKFSDGTSWRVGYDEKGQMLELEQKNAFVAGALPEGNGFYYVPMWEGIVSFDEKSGELVSHRNGTERRARRVTP